jgi:hypothetical protein
MRCFPPLYQESHPLYSNIILAFKFLGNHQIFYAKSPPEVIEFFSVSISIKIHKHAHKHKQMWIYAMYVKYYLVN